MAKVFCVDAKIPDQEKPDKVITLSKINTSPMEFLSTSCYNAIQNARYEGFLLGSLYTIVCGMAAFLLGELYDGRPIYLIPTVGTTDFDIDPSSEDSSSDEEEDEEEEDEEVERVDENSEDESSDKNTTTISEDDEPSPSSSEPTESVSPHPIESDSTSTETEVADYLLQGLSSKQSQLPTSTAARRRLPGSIRAQARATTTSVYNPTNPMDCKDSFLNYSCRDRNHNTLGDVEVKKIRYGIMVDGVKTYVGKSYNESIVVEIKNKYGCAVIPTMVNNLKVDEPTPWYSHDIGSVLVPIEVTDCEYDRSTKTFSAYARISRVI